MRRYCAAGMVAAKSGVQFRVMKGFHPPQYGVYGYKYGPEIEGTELASMQSVAAWANYLLEGGGRSSRIFTFRKETGKPWSWRRMWPSWSSPKLGMERNLLSATIWRNCGVKRSNSSTLLPFSQCSMCAPRTTICALFHSPTGYTSLSAAAGIRSTGPQRDRHRARFIIRHLGDTDVEPYCRYTGYGDLTTQRDQRRSEEHTSELQSR